MDKSHLKLQFDRLDRHYKLAKKDKDPIAFLDLAHTLRIWCELKTVVDNIVTEKGIILNLPNKIKNKKLKKILKGSNFFDVPLVSMNSNDQVVHVKGIQFVDRALTPEEIKEIFEMGVPRDQVKNLSFTQWLASEVIATSDKQDKSYIGISREILIKRTANLLGASHPRGMDNDEHERRFDSHIKELNNIEVANGYPLTHYQLIEIAEVILLNLGKIIR